MKLIINKIRRFFKLAVVSTILSFFGTILITILAIFIRRKKKAAKHSNNRKK